MLTDAQRRAQAKYNREHVRNANVRFYPADAELWEWVHSQGNVAGYLKGLARADMEARRGEVGEGGR